MKRRIVEPLLALGLLPHVHDALLVAATMSPKNVARNPRYRLDPLPIPKSWSRLLVGGSTDVPGFLELRRRGFECIRETLERNGMPISSLRAILDFGCGCGRVLRHWRGQPDKQIYGCDMNEDLVKEAQRCVPFASISRNPLIGRTAFAERRLDLVYAFSALTHLDIEAQRAWLAEFRRILRPAGILPLSLYGEAYKARLSRHELEAFNSGKPIVRRSL